jgi:hypothetical protein
MAPKYDSMEALLAFWNSSEPAETKKLRAGHVDNNFVLVVEAQPR